MREVASPGGSGSFGVTATVVSQPDSTRPRAVRTAAAGRTDRVLDGITGRRPCAHRCAASPTEPRPGDPGTANCRQRAVTGSEGRAQRRAPPVRKSWAELVAFAGAGFGPDQNARRRALDAHAVEALQEGDEGLGVVGREHPADLQLAQTRRDDLYRSLGVAVEFCGDLFERLMLEYDLPAQPSRGALRVHRLRCRWPLLRRLDGELLVGGQPYGVRARLRCRTR